MHTSAKRDNAAQKCLHRVALAVGLVFAIANASQSSAAEDSPVARPNIVLILADDLGYGDLGAYGQKLIQTPHLDRLASTGLRFSACYAGSTVCAPSRCALMTGLHTGHCRIRGNALVPLLPEDVTLAEILRGAGYETALFGKWGLGEPDSTGVPDRQGFDTWFGYLNQVHAHNYYPDYLWRDGQRFPLPGNVVENGVAHRREVYSPDLLTNAVIDWLSTPRGRPFFLFVPYILPHANNEAGQDGMEVPTDEPYGGQAWPQPQKNYAAMVTRLDGYVGRIVEALARNGLRESTLVLFTSDNGPHREGGFDPGLFSSAGELRGIKRDLYEGGIRVPLIANWPGKLHPGQVSDEPVAFWDFVPTLAEIAEAGAPSGIDGRSFANCFMGPAPAASPDRYLYWEFHERGFQQASRYGRWKAVRPGKNQPLELYDLELDLAETTNVAAEHADVVERFEQFFAVARHESPDWPIH